MTKKIILSASILAVTVLIASTSFFIEATQVEAALGPSGGAEGGCQHEYLQITTVTNFRDGDWDQQHWPSSYNTVWCPSME